MTQETAAQNVKNQLKSSIDYKKTEELNSQSMHGKFYQDLERPSIDKRKIPGFVMSLRSKGKNGEFNNSSQGSCTQYVIISGTS
jgi:hypothetical protein